MSLAVTPSKGPRGPSWVHENPYLTIGWEETSESGAPSLKHSAMRQTLSDQSVLTSELFANVPWTIAKYLWDCLGKSKKRTFYMWKLLVTAYPSHFREISRYRLMKIEGPRMPMRDYLNQIKSDTLHWGVALTLFTSFASVPELVEIANVKNLAALELNTSSELETFSNETDLPMTALNDRVVRTWSELAASDAFAHLRVLGISHQKQVSPVILRFLKSFPSLRLLVICDCPNVTRLFKKSSKAIEGWQLADILVDENDSDAAHDKLYGCYRASFTTDEDTKAPDVPILSFQIGREMRRSTNTPSFDIIYLVRQGHPEQGTPEPAAKRQKIPGKHDRPTMREHKGKHLDSVLQEFLIQQPLILQRLDHWLRTPYQS